MRSFMVIGCMIVLLLQGCVPAVFVAGAAAGGAVIYDNRGMQTIAEDRSIVYQAQQKLAHDPELKAQTHIAVTAFNHNVLLVGQAPTQDLHDSAERLVKSVPRVNVIYNEIVISDPISKSVRTKDVWLTTKVKAVLLAEKELKSTQVKVLTENGTVYMMGLVTHQQSELVTEKVRQIEGVQKVVKLFEHIS